MNGSSNQLGLFLLESLRQTDLSLPFHSLESKRKRYIALTSRAAYVRVRVSLVKLKKIMTLSNKTFPVPGCVCVCLCVCVCVCVCVSVLGGIVNVISAGQYLFK